MSNGTNLALSFAADPWSDLPEDRLPTKDNVDFDKEQGKVRQTHSATAPTRIWYQRIA